MAVELLLQAVLLLRVICLGRGSLLAESQEALLKCCTPVERTLKVVSNNLDMLGPGDLSSAPSLRVSGIASGCGHSPEPRQLDAELVATSGYKSADVKQNGLSGSLIRVNVQAGSSLNLTLTLRDSENSGQVKAEELLLSVYAMDQAADQTSRSAVSVQAFKDVFVSKSTTLEQKFDKKTDQTWFVSGRPAPANSGDIKDPNNLSAEQRDRMVVFSMGKVSQASLTLRVGEGQTGHNFLLGVTACSCCAGDAASQIDNSIQLYGDSQPGLPTPISSTHGAQVSYTHRVHLGGSNTHITYGSGVSYGGGSHQKSYGSSSSYGASNLHSGSSSVSYSSSSSYGSSSSHSLHSGGSSYGSSSSHSLHSGGSSYGSSSSSHSLHSGGSSYGSSSSHSLLSGGSSYGASSEHSSYSGSSSYGSSSGHASDGSSASYGRDSSVQHDSSGGAHELWRVAGSRACSGNEIEWDKCPDQPSCSTCVPQDCKFAAWGQWYDAGGCTGLCFRHRGLAQPNNECGRPCNGVQEDTKACFKRECKPASKQDCIFSEWSSWGPCQGGQRQRQRDVAQEPAHGGSPCEGHLREVNPCGQSTTQDCELNQWAEWTTCSCTCGQGWHTRDRRIVKFSSAGGKPCIGSTRQEAPCNVQPCDGKPCLLGEWSEWVGCDGQNPRQRERTRRVAHPGTNGAGCTGSTRETEGCQGIAPQNCEFSHWTDWTKCDKDCNGGQRYRTQNLLHESRAGGGCTANALKQVQGCNQQPCKINTNDCVLSKWGEWSQCSSKCETGVQRRTRQVDRRAGEGGRGCHDALMQVQSCEGKDCEHKDCVWGEWDAWSGCSCTCGGGTKRRNRQVAVSPVGGGQLCDPVDKSEAAPCNTMACESSCVDGLWAEWTSWLECSASCGFGFQWRRRSHRVQANSCGRAAVGNSQDWKICKGSGVGTKICGDLDGILSEWNQWSDCSCTCFGIRERQRIIEQYHHGHGIPIAGKPLKMIEACNPATNEQAPHGCIHEHSDCRLSEWAKWSECPVSCGGANRIRLRYIVTPAANNGKPCEASLRETAPCGTVPCEGSACVDCIWGAWSEWGACSKCGDQRFRSRDIARLPNHCGKICESNTAKEVTNCTSACVHNSYCNWKIWTSWSGCSATCGPATRMRQRSLGLSQTRPPEFLFKVTDEGSAGICAGSQVDTESCTTQACDLKCTPRDCLFGEWGEWNQPTCIGLCTRQRNIAQMNNECGEPCDGPLIGTKRCVEECTERRDCELRAWSSWSQYDRQGAGAQRYRSREISQLPKNGGEQCHGVLREVDSQSAPPGAEETQDCWMAEWSQWFACSKTCGGGWQLRTRGIEQESQGGGKTCSGDMAEGRECARRDCDENDCILGEWSQWSDCWADGQRTRHRSVEQQPSTGGKPCGKPGQTISLTMTASCTQHGVDCEVSAWTNWDACDKSCGGGEQQRHRQVQVYPMSGGKPCPVTLRELRACSIHSCGAVDCQLGPWSEWGTCSSNCGSGQQRRDRQVVRPAQGTGAACEAELAETRACRDAGGSSMPNCGVVNCLWGHWSAWSGCTCSCGGGQRTRNRHIANTPQGGGASCEAVHKEEIEPCNSQKCSESDCKDGRWGEWEEWSQCSQSCAGGLKYRHRRMDQEANDCGTPARGLSRDTSSCNAEVSCTSDLDCQFGEWSQWSACTRTCDGTKRRSRRIAVHGRGHGKWCLGATKESSPCNPSPGKIAPAGCRPAKKQDCVISSWSAWSECDATCGGGQERRERSVSHEAAGGGNACQGSLSETRPCAAKPCAIDTNKKDCQWGEWSQWGACNKCGGQRERFRHILQEAQYGGKPCRLGSAEETGDCPRRCHERTYCMWNPWGEWSQCSMSCGDGGVRHRQRQLKSKSETELKALGLLFEKGEETREVAGVPALLSQGSRLEIVGAFACGILGTVAFAHASRAWTRRQLTERHRLETMLQPVQEPGFFSRWFGGRTRATDPSYMPVSMDNELEA